MKWPEWAVKTVGWHIRSFLVRQKLFAWVHIFWKATTFRFDCTDRNSKNSKTTIVHSHRNWTIDLRQAFSITYSTWTAVRLCVYFTSALEDTGVAVAVSLSKGFHHSVDLLSFTRQTETPQELSAENRSRFRSNQREKKNPVLNSRCRSVS